MRRLRISALQRQILDLAKARGWVIAEFVYRDIYGINPDRRTREPIPAPLRASVSRSLKRLVDHGFLIKRSRGSALWVPPPA